MCAILLYLVGVASSVYSHVHIVMLHSPGLLHSIISSEPQVLLDSLQQVRSLRCKISHQMTHRSVRQSAISHCYHQQLLPAYCVHCRCAVTLLTTSVVLLTTALSEDQSIIQRLIATGTEEVLVFKVWIALPRWCVSHDLPTGSLRPGDQHWLAICRCWALRVWLVLCNQIGNSAAVKLVLSN